MRDIGTRVSNGLSCWHFSTISLTSHLIEPLPRLPPLLNDHSIPPSAPPELYNQFLFSPLSPSIRGFS